MKTILSKYFFLFLLGLFPLLAGCTGNSDVLETSVEFSSSPQGVAQENPRFSWILNADGRGIMQKSYQIKVARSEADLRNGENLVWNSGTVDSDDSHLVSYAGPALEGSRTYWWKVTVRTTDGKEYTSAPAHWTMARDADRPWTAAWIGLNDSTDIKVADNRTTLPVRYLRKEFGLRDKPVRAMLSVSGIGSSYCYLNGRRVGDDVFGPLPALYDASVPFLTYDVTDMLAAGDNAIGVALGNGRYFPMRAEGMLGWGLPRLIAELEVEYPDGTVETIVSDPTWRATADGPVRANNEYDGETFDASMVLGDWTAAGYDDSAWHPAVAMDAPAGRLRAQMSPCIKVMDSISPVSVRKVGDDRYIVDMGQNMVGFPRVRFSGTKDKPVTMRFAEVLQPADSTRLYTDNLRSALVTDTYIPAADGVFEWQPEFVYHGYRFMEVEGVAAEPTTDDIEGLVIYDDMATTGSFECSDEILTRLHRNAYHGIRGNYRGMPTDCPQRDERHGWLGDRTTGAYGESFLFDNALLYRKWLADIEESMSDAGSISDVSPRYWTLHQDDVTWPAAYFYIADMLYNNFGDDYSIRNRYPSMKKWVEHMMADHMTDYIITTDTYGDWCLPPESLELIHSNDPARRTDGRLLSTSVFYSILQLMQKFADINGCPDDKARYAAIAEKMKDAYNAEFYHPDTHSYANNTVTANLLSLRLGLVPEGDAQAVCDNAVRRTVEECDGHVSVGVLGIQHLMRGLTEHGSADLAFSIASNDTYPSWGYMIRRGATTIWELWNGDTADPAMNSRNHVMLLGDVLIWMYEDLAGIANHPDTVGFKKILMKPVFPAGLDAVSASHRTPYGTVSSSWTKKDDDFEWTVTIPANTTAEIVLPTALGASLQGDTAGVISVAESNGNTHTTLGSGTYTFRRY